jgi:hypothetical protein
MAILEIARIQVRRGQENVTGAPILSPGEFGWAQDTEHLWIGKSVAEGAPDNNNTRILTETDLNLFNISLTTASSTVLRQEYQGHTPGRTVVNNTTDTTIQSKFDLFVSIFDFNANNNPSDLTSNNAICIQNAIDALYLDGVINSSNLKESTRVGLRIPAGLYNITESLEVPSYVTLIGEGQGRTVLNLINTTTSLIKFIGGDSSKVPFGSMNNSNAPRNINLIGITFQYSTSTGSQPLVQADCAINSSIVDCQFKGKYTAGTGQTINSRHSGIEIRAQGGGVITKDLEINNCSFDNLYYGIISDYDIEDARIEKSKFENLNRGIVHAETVVNFTGPLRTKIIDNKFLNIEREAVRINTSTSVGHVSSLNVYKEVGNNLLGDSNPISPVITFGSNQNVSTLDSFSRYQFINNTTTSFVSTTSYLVSGRAYLENLNVSTKNLVSSTTTNLVRIPFNGVEESIELDYNLFKPSAAISRKGRLDINVSLLSGIPTVTLTDSYSYQGSGDGNLEFSASLNTSTKLVSVNYLSADADGTITFKHRHLQ